MILVKNKYVWQWYLMSCILVQCIILNIHRSKAITIWPIKIIALSTFGTSKNFSIVYKPFFSQPCKWSKRCPWPLLKSDFPCHLFLSTSICFYLLQSNFIKIINASYIYKYTHLHKSNKLIVQFRILKELNA